VLQQCILIASVPGSHFVDLSVGRATWWKSAHRGYTWQSWQAVTDSETAQVAGNDSVELTITLLTLMILAGLTLTLPPTALLNKLNAERGGLTSVRGDMRQYAVTAPVPSHLLSTSAPATLIVLALTASFMLGTLGPRVCRVNCEKHHRISHRVHPS
jgi:hypothetical protein